MNTQAQFPDFVRFLLDPASHDGQRPELAQTHISWVVLAGDTVYKFKKPVNFGFLDFSTLEKRQFYCAEELRLNRRLCPEIYLDLVAVCRQKDGSLALVSAQDAKAVVEYGVRMRRMPEDRMMIHLIERGELGEAHIDQLVDLLVPFYAQAARQTADGASLARFGAQESVTMNILENFEQTKGFLDQGALSSAQFKTISDAACAVLAQPARFQKRIDADRICECHGDLYSANICLAEKPYVFDCIEFNERFRYSDVAADVAFLAMDLDFHGLENLSCRFIERFADASGDAGLLDMLDFYKGYRAYVRGKIGLFTAQDQSVDEKTRQHSLTSAARYFALAERYAQKQP